MPTKFYLRRFESNVGNAPAPTSALGGTPTWTPGQTNSVANTPLLTNYLLHPVINTAAGYQQDYSTDNVTTAQTQPLAAFISNPLTAQTIAAQSVTCQLGFGASSTVSAFQWQWFLGVYRPATGTLVATLRARTASSSATSTTSVVNSALTNTISAFTTQEGDVLVLEIWRNTTVQTMATSYTNSIVYDGSTEGGASSTNAAFLNFTNNVTLYTPTTPVDTYGAAVMATSGLQHYWRLNEAASAALPNLFDSKGGVTTPPALLLEQGGVLLAQPTMSKLGNLGVTFPTARTTDVIGAGVVTTMTTFTWSFEMWVKPSASAPGATTYYAAMSSNLPVLGGWVIQQDGGTAGRLGLFFGNGSSTYGPIWFSATPDDWHHVVITLASSVWQLYVDAVLQGTLTQSISMGSSWRFELGHWPGGTTNSMQGSLDEVAFYNVVLPLATIQDHYSKGYIAMPDTAFAGPADRFN